MAEADPVAWRDRVWAGLLALPATAFAAALAGPVAGVVVAGLALQIVLAWSTAPRVGAAARTITFRLVRGTAGFLAALPGVTRRAAPRAWVAVRIALVRIVPAAVGCLVVLVAVDWGVGTLWHRATADAVDAVPAVELARADLPPPRDPRARSEALADSPWADRYFSELEAVPATYLPFVGPREAPVHGRFINSAEGIRRSYEPPGAEGDDAVTVWFFGGSTLWGEGQRDRHTIPSEVARLAEENGVTLRVVNYGIRGYTAFQEFLVFEQELARRDPPDVAVFYHGANESYSLLEAPGNLGSQPSMYQLDTVAEAFDRAPPLPQAQSPREPSVGRDYLETSLLNKLSRAVRGAVEAPAGAQEPAYRATIEQIDRALVEAEQIYRRSVDLIHHVATEHDVPTLILWQPAGPPPAAPSIRDDYADLGDRVSDVGIDISDALEHPPAPIYIDGLHTNELGARLSAEAIWSHLGPAVGAVVDR